MFKQLIFSTEGIAFQPRSKFSQELISIMKELKEYPYTLPDNINKDFIKIFRSTLNYFEKTITPKLQKCIYTHTGIVIDTVICEYPNNEPMYTADFAMTMGKIEKNKFKPEKWFASAKDIISGYSSKTSNINVETADELNNLLARFDDEVGRFKLPDNRMIDEPNMLLFFDIVSVCFAEQVVHENIASFTAEEASAIILHEVGHCINTLSYAKYTCYSIDILKKAFKHFEDYASVEEKIKFIKSNKVINNNKLIDKSLLSTVEVIKEINNKIVLPKMPGSIGANIITIIGKLISLLINIALKLFFMPCVFLIRCLMFTMINASNNSRINDDTKTSDFKGLNFNLHAIENIADEYVTKHNLGSYLITGLEKLDKAMLFLRGTNSHPYTKKVGNLNFNIMTFFGIIEEVDDSLFLTSISNYPILKERTLNILQDQMKILKETSNNPKTLALALNEYNKMFLLLKNETKVDKTRKMVKSIEKILDKINSIGTLSLFGTDANQAYQLNELLIAANNLMHSDIYASAIRIDLITRK